MKIFFFSLLGLFSSPHFSEITTINQWRASKVTFLASFSRLASSRNRDISRRFFFTVTISTGTMVFLQIKKCYQYVFEKIEKLGSVAFVGRIRISTAH